MKKLILSLSLVFCITSMLFAQSSAYQFTDDVVVPHTSVKNQAKSGTCWCFAGLGMVEAEILRKFNFSSLPCGSPQGFFIIINKILAQNIKIFAYSVFFYYLCALNYTIIYHEKIDILFATFVSICFLQSTY